MIRAILFDMGGTLDGDGQHWLERFLALYRAHGIDLPRETIRNAFDEAERRANVDEAMATAGLREMIERHVEWQFAFLRLENHDLERQFVDRFLEPMTEATQANARLLADLAVRGFELGVVSNGCGNVDRLCADFGYASFLSLVIDSRRVGLFKPDPAIYRHAAAELGRAAAEIMMVGDSFERDIVPARKVGMKTAWLEGAAPRDCPDPSLIDVRLRKLSDLPAALNAFTPALT
jgi:putative hydrolase of the HAD superfamily